MKKIILIIIVFLSFIFNVRAKLDLNSRNAILYNLNDDQIIFEKNINDVEQIASITNIMTI